MVRPLGRLLGILAVLGALLAPAAMAAAKQRSYVVVFKNRAVSNVHAATAWLHASLGVNAKYQYGRALKGFAADLSSHQLRRLAASSLVAYIEPDTVFKATGMVSLAAGETEPVGISRIGAATRSLVHTSSGVAVAELDTGIDLSNRDLNAVNGVNCIKPGTTAQDDNGHGTNVAGTIAGQNQGAGVVGVAPGTQIYAVKVLAKSGSGTLSQILCGINWVTANAAALNIKVVNMSLAGGGANDGYCGLINHDAEHQAICNSTSAGVSYVAAAGNESSDFGRDIPAAYPEVLTVTAMTDTDGIPGGKGPKPCVNREKDDTYATYSNYAVSAGEQAHTIAAPGTCVLSDDIGNKLSTYYGTSQAAPHVTGSLALCMNDGGVPGPCAGLTPPQAISKLMGDSAAYATSLNGFSGDPWHPVSGKYYGYLVNTSTY